MTLAFCLHCLILERDVVPKQTSNWTSQEREVNLSAPESCTGGGMCGQVYVDGYNFPLKVKNGADKTKCFSLSICTFKLQLQVHRLAVWMVLEGTPEDCTDQAPCSK